MATSVKDATEKSPPKPVFRWVSRCHDRPVKDLPVGELGVQVDIGGQDKVLVVIPGSFAEGDQIGGRGDLVRVLGRPAAPAVLGVGGKTEKANRDQERDCPQDLEMLPSPHRSSSTSGVWAAR
jgi:hypothetical protein